MNAEAKLLARSSLIPSALRNKPEEIVTIALMGRSLGLSMLDAALYIPIINGRPFVETKALGAMLNARGYQWMFEETTAERCTVMGRHPNDPKDWPLRRLTFTMAEAKAAGLTKNPAYGSAPADMLRHRTLGKWVRANTPEILTGLASMGLGLVEADGEVTEPARVDLSGGDVIEGELVDNDVPVTTEQVTESWGALWSAACKTHGADRAVASALAEYVTQGKHARGADIEHEADRTALLEALKLWKAGELVVRDGRIVEVDGTETGGA
jgi:hypothetical protein